MSALRAVAAALDALSVRPPHAYTWLGEGFDILPPIDGDAALAEALRERLYVDFYCAGGVAPATVPRLMPPRGAPAPPERGVSAQPGWTASGTDGDDLVVRADGLTLRSEAWRVRAPGGPVEGAPVTVEIPATGAGAPAGFRTTAGIAGPGMRFAAGVAMDRIYWNVRPEHADALVTAVADALDERMVPFRMKTANDTRIARCDAAVLYVPRTARRAVGDALRAVAPGAAAMLRGGTPVFTRRLAPGIGFAEDPGGEESFGEHRCRLLAAAVVRTARRGVTSSADRLAAVAAAFAAAGVPLERAHLCPGSDPGTVAALTPA